MKLKERMQNSFFALSDNRLLGRKKLAISYVSLFLVFTLVLVTTVAWFTVEDRASINSQPFSLESSAALRVNDGQEDLSNHLVVKGFKLEEASSVDGRNMFFPSEGNFKDSTSAMKFREGTAGDRNKTYVYKEFKLSADSDMTNVYIKGYNIKIVSAGGEVLGKFDGSTEIKYNDKGVPVDQKVYDPCPLRLAFITDSSKTPTVIDPSALVDKHAKNYNAVSSTNMDGSPATKLSTCKTFSDFYFYSGESLFTLFGQKPLDVTLVAWFEGAYEDQSVYDKYAGASVTIDVELESNYNDMEAITFVDDTIGDNDDNVKQWIKTGDCIVTMQYTDTDGTQKTVVMKDLDKVDGHNTWTAALPKDVVTNISFFRFSTTDNTIYNSWHTKVGVSNELSDTAKDWIKYNNDLYELQESREVNGKRSLVYTAKRGNGHGQVKEDDPELTKKRLSPCIGYWDYNPGGSTVETTVPSVTTPTSGGDSSEDTVTTSVYLDIPDYRGWLRSDLATGRYTPYVIYYYDGKETPHKMTVTSEDGGRCELVGCEAPKDSRVKGFKFVNNSDSTAKYIAVAGEYMFSTSSNVTYQVNNDDKATYH